MPDNPNLREDLQKVADSIVNLLVERGKTYGDSWKRRGGVGASMMLFRKHDRVENIIEQNQWDVFAALRESENSELDLEDDIRDIMGYCLLILAEWHRIPSSPVTLPKNENQLELPFSE